MDYDFEDELRGNKEDPMNVKVGPFGAAVLVGVVAAVVPIFVNRYLDHASDTTTVTAIAELKTQVAGLTTQVSKLTDFPYVRRDEFETRLSGLERRVDTVEQRPDRHR